MTWDQFTVTAKPLAEVVNYGDVVPMEFTVKNGHDVPVFLERAEATAGRRWELMAFSRRVVTGVEEPKPDIRRINPDAKPKSRVLFHHGLLMPGQELRFVLPYRILAGEDRILLTITPLTEEDLVGKIYLLTGVNEFKLADAEGIRTFGAASTDVLDAANPGMSRVTLLTRLAPLPEPIQAYDTARLPAPVAPFDPKWGRNCFARPEAWAFSPSLGGYIVRVRAGSYSLQTEEEVLPLPPLPFQLFEAIDGKKGGTKILRHTGDVTLVTRENVLEVLEEVLRARRQVTFSDDPSRAPFEEKEL